MQTVVENILKFNVPVDKLSKKSNIPINRLKSILDSAEEPLISEITAIARALKVQPDFLFAPSQSYNAVTTLFRKAVNSKDQIVADKVSYIVSNILEVIGNYRPNIEIIDRFPKVENTFQGINQLVSIFRQDFAKADFYSPLLNLPELVAAKLDCILLVIELGEGVDGASAIINGIPFILISPRFKPRMLFTLAHEVGHIIAHHRDQNSFGNIDFEYKRSIKKIREEEVFAFAFASDLLLPVEGVANALKFIRKQFQITVDFLTEFEILYLSRIFGVSFEVAALRCENLDFLPAGAAFSLSESLKKDYGSPEKRAEQLQLPGRPDIVFPKVSSNLMKAVIEKIVEGNLSIGRAAEILSITTSELIHFNAFEEWM
ncbi:MAG: Zn-dependent peptidase ImmA, family [Mucilaginibacter sp.]|nr:Zn-dependent peptidase ImmA, family [Mucilaginibacter sp.]